MDITKNDVEPLLLLDYGSIPAKIRDESWKLMKQQLKYDGRTGNAQQAEKKFMVTDRDGNHLFPVTCWLRDAVAYEAWALFLLECGRKKRQEAIMAGRRELALRNTAKKKAAEVAATGSSSGARPALVTVDELPPQAGGKTPRVVYADADAGKAMSLVLPRSGVVDTHTDDVPVRPLAVSRPPTDTNKVDEDDQTDNVPENNMYSKETMANRGQSDEELPSDDGNIRKSDAVDSSSNGDNAPPLSADSPLLSAHEVTIVNGRPTDDIPFVRGRQGTMVKFVLRPPRTWVQFVLPPRGNWEEVIDDSD